MHSWHNSSEFSSKNFSIQGHALLVNFLFIEELQESHELDDVQVTQG